MRPYGAVTPGGGAAAQASAGQSVAAVAAALAHCAADMARVYGVARGERWREVDAAERRLRDALAGADARRRADELAIWRDHHGATCRSASSLAPAIFAHGGDDLDAAVRALGPDGEEARWLVGREYARRWRRAGRSRAPCRDMRDGADRDRFLHSGHVVRRSSRNDRALGIRMSAFGLEVAFAMGEILVRTHGDEAVIFVGTWVPETVKVALPGRPVGDLVDHPVLRDPALVVMGVDVEPAPYSLGPGSFSLTIRAPRVPWRAPWSRDGASGARG